MTRSSAELEGHIQRFLKYLGEEKQLSPNTIKAYTRDLARLLDFLESEPHFEAKLWSDVSPHLVRKFISNLHQKGLSSRSLQRVLSALRSFYSYLSRELEVRVNPATGISAPKKTRKLPRTMDTDQVAQLLKIKGGDWHTVRDRAIMELLYSSGLRLSELVGLDIGDLDLDDQTVRVTGKGNKTRDLPIGLKATQAIKSWLECRATIPRKKHLESKPDPALAAENALFISDRARRISPRTVQVRLRKWQISQSLPGALHPHMLRHSFASHMLESSGNLRAVQELLGHADISTTQIYTHLDFQHLARVYDSAHPRAKRKS